MNEMDGKIVLITGATSGLGKVVAVELAKKRATVVIAGRDPAKTRVTVKEIEEQSEHRAAADGLVTDLSSMGEVRRLANEFEKRYSRLDVLINNVGAIFAQRLSTVDGYERTFALNHLSQFLLTNLLLDTLKASAPSRIVNVSSRTHQGGTINFDNLQGERYGIGGGRAYSQSKLSNIMLTYELARRLAGTGVTANAVHPGTVATSFGENNGWLMGFGMKVFHRFAIPPEEGADTIIYLASSPEVEGISGQYWAKRQPIRSSPASYDESAQKRLWDVSVRMTGLAARAHV
jgi:NAD(P)-dependent dehydrogenase (short-subunit alcohol dehydrogenase family)